MINVFGNGGEDEIQKILDTEEKRRLNKARDKLARAALNGMLAHPTRYKPRPSDAGMHWHDAISKEAYEIADAMLKARE